MSDGLVKLPKKEPARCGHCNLHVSMTCVDERRLRPGYGRISQYPHVLEAVIESPAMQVAEEVWVCGHCEEPTLRLVHFLPFPLEGGKTEVRRHEVTLYPRPQPRGLEEAAPEPVRSFFTEGSLCQTAGARRAAGVLYRAAVEEICNDFKATGPNLYKRIEALAANGLAPETIADFHEVRMLGNDSIHDGLEYSADEVDDVADLIEEAVYELYVEPDRKAAYRKKRTERRKNQNTSP
ncbi:DUF4145 domain-containing protein [Thermomonospora umbrina]|uniref:Uncharacterized protein DUF4145 n=1 Tax=Thermomonospora umbrina TaxID=111806 RepID=A0A3D9T0M9_9ACTN|nr:DUF4145 domain-containing protein [Thermomonospora umbrina]REF00361.1 uncharacterized protein DUF4145 [Thermomonospora umbrina]